MSGWIKFEKDLFTDPRFMRMCRAYVTQARITPANAATQLVGALVTLWCYADTHIREDDTLDFSPDEVDEFVGVQGFTALMPADWLEVLETHSIKLPGFQEHNGTEAKKRALTQKRVARHRVRTVTQDRSNNTGSGNGGALPDQTRPDQTRPEKKVPTEPVPQGGTIVPRETKSEAVARIFAHWQTTHGHERSRLDAKRRKLIHAALDGYSEADLCQAITGYLNSPHHMGENDRNTKFDDIELMLRDSKHIDAGLRFYAEPPRTDVSAQTRRIIKQTEGWVPPELRRVS